MGNSTSQPTATTQGMEKTDSVSRIRTISGRHSFEIQNFSLTKERGVGTCIFSEIFFVGGFEWRIICNPHGDNNDVSEFMSVFLQFVSKSGAPVTSFSLSLLNYATGKLVYDKKPKLHTFKSSLSSWGFPKFLAIKTLEASKCLQKDSLTIICDLTVINEPVTYSRHPSTVPVSQFNIHERLAGLLSSRTGVDITIEVGGKLFYAHKIVLAASSPVFEAQIFGQTIEAKESKINISDMETAIFEAMLYFIYNNTLPQIDKCAETAITQHLLVAADRYMLENLRKTCEQKLCDSLDASNVSTTLALAEQHNITHLKSECLRYLESKEALSSAIKTDDFEHLLKSCPIVVKDIISKVL